MPFHHWYAFFRNRNFWGAKHQTTSLRIPTKFTAWAFNTYEPDTGCPRKTMASLNSAPYASQHRGEVDQLVHSLEAHSKKGNANSGKSTYSCKKATFAVPGPGQLTVDSWRFRDWDYKRDDLPTYARGLFTYSPDGRYSEIAVRGYDKFFNTEEVSTTRWSNIEKNTRGPYELSVKENGCIIFISGLADDTLLVCSKHSTGARQDTDVSHALAGEKWVDRQLAGIGKTRAELARELRKRNITAVAELCDDSFEEHILAYDEKSAGLYLHGVNLNVPEFATYPSNLVQKFADAWGFKQTHFLVKEDIHSTHSFLDSVAETGSWQGRDVEGFVIRCQARDSSSEPYYDWFFKYKFEEPYLMFRQWREVTKSLIAGKPPRYKKHKKITDEYLQFARRRLAMNPHLGKQFNQNHGIIAMREGFLQEKGATGADIAREETASSEAQDISKNIVLVPIATIGCGKTTVAVALQKLFNWGHIQNDNIEGKKNRPMRFANEVCNNLATSNVTIADRNNHQKRERKQLLDDIHRMMPEAHFVALHYVHYLPQGGQWYKDEIRKAMWKRVFSRGDNHQTIRAGTQSEAEIRGIMDGFMNRFEPADPMKSPDDGFDSIIDLDPTVTSRDNLETVVRQLHAQFPKLFFDYPTDEDLDAAIEAALREYAPDVKQTLNFQKKSNGKKQGQAKPNAKAEKPLKLEFFCIKVPAEQIKTHLEALFTNQPPEVAGFYRWLQRTRRVQPTFHVTLVHRAESAKHLDIWKQYVNLYSKQPNAGKEEGVNLGSGRVQLERVVWDTRVMCIVVRLPDAQSSGFDTTNEIAHITIGTGAQHIKPVESNALLKSWLAKGSNAQSGIHELPLGSNITLVGTVTAVMSRS